jgi:hypothetical protein
LPTLSSIFVLIILIFVVVSSFKAVYFVFMRILVVIIGFCEVGCGTSSWCMPPCRRRRRRCTQVATSDAPVGRARPY